MFKESMKLSMKLVGVIVVVTLAFQYFESKEIVPVVIIVISLYMLYAILFKGNKEITLEILCDAEKYLKQIQEKNTSKENLKNLFMAYGLFYNNQIEESISYHGRVKYEDINTTKHKFIYHMLSLKYSFDSNDVKGYKDNLDALRNSGVLKKVDTDELIFDVPLLLMNQEYDKAAELLVRLIPFQKKRYYILELEYYLALCYKALGEKENYYAVLDFMTKKEFKIVYIYKCRKLLDEIK